MNVNMNVLAKPTRHWALLTGTREIGFLQNDAFSTLDMVVKLLPQCFRNEKRRPSQKRGNRLPN